MSEEKRKTKKEQVEELLYVNFPWSADVQDSAKKEYCQLMAEFIADIYKK